MVRVSYELATVEPRDPPVECAPSGAVLVVDRPFLHRDELVDTWDLSVFPQITFEVSVARMAARDESSADPARPSVSRYVEGQRLHFAACRPWDRADVVADTTDLDAPILLSSA